MLSEVSRIQYFRNSRSRLKVFVTTVDDRNPALPGDPKLWELWQIPYSG